MADWCIVAGPVASVVVEALKRFPVVQRYPKVIMALLTAGYSYALGTGLECWFTAFATGIAGYEVVIKPVKKGGG